MTPEQRSQSQLLIDRCDSLSTIAYDGDAYVSAASLLRELLAQDLEDKKDLAYVTWRMKTILPLFEEARDALPAISEVSRRLHGVSPTLADRMDAAGTATREDFDAAIAKDAP